MSHITPRRSIIPTTNLWKFAYLETPCFRCLWFTGTTKMLQPSLFARAGKKRWIWSKYGNRRNKFLSNNFKPHPVSGLSSFNRCARIVFAIFDAERFAQESFLVTLCPVIIAKWVSWLCSYFFKRLGMSAGSFWPSPSRVTIMLLLAARIPVRSPALWPERCKWWITRISDISFLSFVNVTAVASALQSCSNII